MLALALIVAIGGFFVALDALSGSPSVLLLGTVAAAAWALFVVRSTSSRVRALTAGAAIASASGILLLAGTEIVTRAMLVEERIPKTDREFRTSYSFSWPHAIPEEKPAGTVRIVGLADSFGQAGGKDNYHYVLETLLRARGVRAEVVNLSSGSYAPEDELEVLRRIGARYHPDIVLHGFYVGNDFGESPGRPIRVKGIPMRTVTGLAAWRPAKLVSVTWVHRFLKGLDDARARKGEAASHQPTGVFAEKYFKRFGAERVPLLAPTPPPEERWAYTATVLGELDAEARRQGAVYVALLHPDRFQVEEDLRTELQSVFAARGDTCAFGLPQRYLCGVLAARGVPVIDLLPTFRAEGATGGLFQFRDTHYERRGNAIAAGVVADSLYHWGLVTRARDPASRPEPAPEPARSLR